MAYQWFKTSYPGVRYRKHPTRKYGVNFDQYFTIRYQKDGKRQEEALGWASAGWNTAKANARLAELKEAARTGNGEKTLREKRMVAEQNKIEAEQQANIQKQFEITFGNFFDETYLPQCKSDKKPHTAKTEETFFNHWIRPAMGDLQFDQISISHLDKIKSNMKAGKRAVAKSNPRDRRKASKNAQQKRTPAKSMSPRSINYVLAIIR